MSTGKRFEARLVRAHRLVRRNDARPLRNPREEESPCFGRTDPGPWFRSGATLRQPSMADQNPPEAGDGQFDPEATRRIVALAGWLQTQQLDHFSRDQLKEIAAE